MEDARYVETAGEFACLDRAESLRLLATVPVAAAAGHGAGRAADLHSTVARKLDGTIVTFEADELDAGSYSGWSVTVTGRAALVTDPAGAERYRQVPLVPWAAGSRD